jgi:hypothetical protein
LGLLLVLPLLCVGQARAADKGDFKLLFNTSPDPATAKDFPLLRPNVVQDFYLFVQNNSATEEAITVDVLEGDKPIDGGSVTFPAKAKGVTAVPLGKAPAPAPAEKPAAPPPPAAVPAPPPELAPLKGELKFVLHGKDKDGKRVDLQDPVRVVMPRPTDYVEVTGVYDPRERGGIKNQLILTVKAKDSFQGGRCRVDLVLNPAVIPDFVEVPKKEGTRAGYLQRAGDQITLTANNLQFSEASTKSDELKPGLVYVTIDGYERAYIFESTFPRRGETTSELTRVDVAAARMKFAPGADPSKPYPVSFEIDNTDPKTAIELGLDRDASQDFNRQAGEIVIVGTGDRKQQLQVNPAFPGHALQLKRLISDWDTKLDVAEIYGPRLLRLRLLENEAEADKDVRDGDKSLVKFLDMANYTGTKTPVSQILETVTFDGTKPENLKFLDFPKQLERGSELPVRATASDPESGIKSVAFYIGKPGPDGKPPATAVLVPGKLLDPKTGVWVASLDAPTDQKGKTEVTAQFTNGAGLVATDTVKIELIDPGAGAAGAGKAASIAGKVFVGDRPQPDVAVELRNAAGAVLDTKATDKDGKFLFKDVAPGTYKVFSSKRGQNQGRNHRRRATRREEGRCEGDPAALSFQS